MKLSVVIPVHNEINTILELYNAVKSVNLDKEIILVDDFSTDGFRQDLRRGEEDQLEGRLFSSQVYPEI